MVNGKAKLMRDDYCDGLGDCLPACPAGCDPFVGSEAAAYDERQWKNIKRAKRRQRHHADVREARRAIGEGRCRQKRKSLQTAGEIGSELTQWPVQIKLAPVRAPYFDGAKLLIAADCSAYAYGDFTVNSSAAM